MRKLSLAILFTVLLVGLVAAQTPKTAADYINRGTNLLRTGQIDDAIADFSKAIEIDSAASKGAISDEMKSRLGRAHFSRGLAWHSKSDLDKALTDFDKAVSLDPGNANAFMMRGLVRITQGLDEDANRDFKKSVALDSRNQASVEQITNRGYWIRYIASSPRRDTTLRAGEHVKLSVTLGYRLTAATEGDIALVLQRVDNSQLIPGHSQVMKHVSQGSGEITLTDEFDVPTGVNRVRLFIPLIPSGYLGSEGEVVIEFPVKTP
jgi:tetratricopeptide (TPR) repeat protein